MTSSLPSFEYNIIKTIEYNSVQPIKISENISLNDRDRIILKYLDAARVEFNQLPKRSKGTMWKIVADKIKENDNLEINPCTIENRVRYLKEKSKIEKRINDKPYSRRKD